MSSSVGIGRPNRSNLGKVDVSTVVSTGDTSSSSRIPIDLELRFFVFLVEDKSLDDLLFAPKPPPPPPAKQDVQGFRRDGCCGVEKAMTISLELNETINSKNNE